jgi:hypothetical protein
MEERLSAASKSAAVAEEAATVARAASKDSERKRQGLEKKLVSCKFPASLTKLACWR